MKKTTAVIVAICVFLTLSFSVFAKNIYLYPSSVIKDKSSFQLVAHRGLDSLAPENSLAAFRLAGEYGFSYCEFDIYPTSDEKWVIMHDSSIDRTTNGSGNIGSMTFDELREFKIDKGSNIKKYNGEIIPELSEALDICAKFGVHPVIEIKGGSSAQLKRLCEYLESRSEVKDFVITSFSTETLKTVRNNMPQVRIWLLAFAVSDYDISVCKRYGFECLDSNAVLTNEADIKKVTSSGLSSGVWSVNSVGEIEKYYSYGVTYVTTDDILPLTAPKTETTTKKPAPTTQTSTMTQKPDVTQRPAATTTEPPASQITTTQKPDEDSAVYSDPEAKRKVNNSFRAVSKALVYLKVLYS